MGFAKETALKMRGFFGSTHPTRSHMLGGGFRIRLVVLEIVIPDIIEPRERLVGTWYRKLLAIAFQQSEPFEFAERIVDLEIDIDPECLMEPALDALIELFLCRRGGRRDQEIIGQERLLAFLILGGTNDGIE